MGALPRNGLRNHFIENSLSLFLLARNTTSHRTLPHRFQERHVAEQLTSNINNALTHCIPVLLFYTNLKHQKTYSFSDFFRGYRKATPGCNGLSHFTLKNLVNKMQPEIMKSKIFNGKRF